MRIAYQDGHRAELRHEDLPVRSRDQTRLRVAACGICGTDLHRWPGSTGFKRFGHEVAGVVLESEAGPQAGETVVLESSSACGRCEPCRNNRQDLCAKVIGLPFTGMAEEMLVPEKTVVAYRHLDPAVACLAEPLGVALDLVQLAGLTPQSEVLVMGAGPIGLMAAMLARAAGVRRLWISERSDRTARLALARRYADEVLDPVARPLDTTGIKPNRILVTAPPPVIAEAVTIAGYGGIIVFIGIAFGGDALVQFDANAFHFRKLQLRASYAVPALLTPMALETLVRGTVDGPALVSHRFPLDQIDEALRVARDPAAIKVVVMP